MILLFFCSVRTEALSEITEGSTGILLDVGEHFYRLDIPIRTIVNIETYHGPEVTQNLFYTH